MALTLLEESWTWFGFVIVIVCLRFTSRLILMGSIRKLAFEDWLMLVVVILYTVLIVSMNIVSGVNTNLIDPANPIEFFTTEDRNARIYGSKIVLLVEQTMIMTQWGCKICLLLLYSRITTGLKQNLAVKVVGTYVIVALVVMEICYFGVWCRPINQYWAVPTNNIQCSAAIHHLIMNAVFNISSDSMMLGIPLPLLLNSKLPGIKKAALCILFGLGIFVILCAALNKYYSFTQPFSVMWEFWYVREASVAILIANLPNCWPLVRKLFDLRSFNGSSTGNTYGSSRLTNTLVSGVRSLTTKPRQDNDLRVGGVYIDTDLEMGSQIHLSNNKNEEDSVDIGSLHLNSTNSNSDSRQWSERAVSIESHSAADPGSLQIWRRDEVRVHGQQGDGTPYDGFSMGVGSSETNAFRTRTTVTAQPASRDLTDQREFGRQAPSR